MEIYGPLNMNFQKKILASFEFLGVSNCQQTADKISIVCLHIQLKSKREGRNNEFWQAVSS